MENSEIRSRRFLLATLMAWIVFIGVDFLFHGSILSPFWLTEHPSLKPLEELALLIPAGYTSFLVLTVLAGWLYRSVYAHNPGTWQVVRFGFTLAGLYAVGNFLGLYSFIDLPVPFLLLINLVYFLELLAVVLVYAHLLPEGPVRKKVIRLTLLFFLVIVAGIVVQNIYGFYDY